MGRLVASPERAVAFLGKKLQNTPPDSKRIEQLIADLDNNRFQVRERARQQLEALADRAIPALRKALAGTPPLEVRLRVEALLERFESEKLLPETVRQLRAVEALETIGSAAARRLLEQLAAGPGETWLVQEARAAVQRLAKRATGSSD
jgi:hypothetical protein